METTQLKPASENVGKIERRKTRLVSLRLPEDFIEQAIDWGFKNRHSSLAKSIVALGTPTLNNSTSVK